MPYQEVFTLFWEQLKESVQEGRFAKLTMAKTIGKPDLKNIFLRPVFSDNGHKFLLKYSYRSRETEDEEELVTLDAAFLLLKPHLKKSFLSVLLFTTTKDVTFKINKKGMGSITENSPTFFEVIFAEKDSE